MIIKETIIVAGGLGTRLQSVLREIPKPMADIKGRPFLEYLLNHVTSNGVERVILSIGYNAQMIIHYFDQHPLRHLITYSIEDEPLGTGGGIRKALEKVGGRDVLIINGDTFFDIDIQELYRYHRSQDADLTLALKEMEDCSRYGRVMIDENFRTICFEEKKGGCSGLINAGNCIIKKRLLDNMPETFSFEKDFVEKYYGELDFYGKPFDNYFIDIGVPEDYERAKKELK